MSSRFEVMTMAIQRRTSTLFIGAFLFAGCAFAGCGDPAGDGAMVMEDPPVPPTEHPPEPEPCATGAFCFDAQFGSQLQQLTLGARTTVNTAVVLSKKLMGQTVNFSIVTPIPQSDLMIEVSPASITVGDDVNIPVEVSLQVPTASAYEGGKTIALHAEAMGPAATSADSKAVTVALDPRLIVEYSGKGGMANPHTWTIPGNDPLKIGIAGQKVPTVVKLRTQGVRVSFVNKDTTASHVIHCGGAIPHQPTDKPTPPNGFYSPLIQTSGSASCYDHNLESQSVAVYFQFNK